MRALVDAAVAREDLIVDNPRFLILPPSVCVRSAGDDRDHIRRRRGGSDDEADLFRASSCICSDLHWLTERKRANRDGGEIMRLS